MTLSQPAAATLKVSDFVNRVKAALQNRDDVSESQDNPEMRPSAWVRDTLRELTANWEFAELQVQGPVVTVGPGLGYQGSNYMYPLSMFLNPGDDVTLTQDPVIFLTPQQAMQVGKFAGTITETVGYGMDRLSMKAIQPMLFVPGGIPFKYCRYGNMMLFGTQPGTEYQIYLPYQRRHPFNPDLVTSPVMIPQEWNDIVQFAAAERGAVMLRWNDQASYLHQLLYGDPNSQLKDGTLGRPGLIAARLLQDERDRMHSVIQISCVAQRY